jgi:Mg2+/Co2+ transporter CorC
VLHHIGRIPRVGDTVAFDGMLFRVETMRRRMIAEISVTLPEEAEADNRPV